MDILYTLGKGSAWQDNELRYSLRSLEKYGRNVGRIYIVGDWCPPFINREKLTVIECQQPYKDKFKNILYSIVYACEHSDISDEFLLSSDDHFYMQPTDFDEYPYYIKSEELPSSNCLSGYKRCLWETRCLLQKHGYGIRNYAQHCNTHFVKSVLLAHKNIIEESFTLYKGVEATCLMLNILMSERPFEPTAREDLKIRDSDPKEMMQALKGRDCFSIGDRAVEITASVLKEEFPHPSRYEISSSCCVAIPIYKESMSSGEEKSIDQTFKVMSGRSIYFFAPEGLDMQYYENRYAGRYAGVKRFDDSYFGSIEGYSRLMTRVGFYKAFEEWDYMLIVQPDCWTFRDDLDEFCNMGYDYIGAPWPPMKNIETEGVGNGGFSLRKVRKFIGLCENLKDEDIHPEDRFFCIGCADKLNIAPMKVGAHFSLEHKPIQYYHRFGKVTPMGCHKPFRFSYEEFWKKLGVPDIKP